MMSAMMSVLIVALAMTREVAAVAKGFHLVQTNANSMWFNYNLDLATNQSSCFNVSDIITTGVSPTATVSVITTNPDHSTYDISFTFFPHRQVIGGVPQYKYYRNSTKPLYAEYSPQSYWRTRHPTCTTNVLPYPDLKPFDQICIVNTCGKGTCIDGPNTFEGQLKIDGYTTTQQLSVNPVSSQCNDENVGQLQWVAYFPTTSYINFQVSAVNGSGVCQTFAPSYQVGNVPYALELNMTLDNQGSTKHFALQFLNTAAGTGKTFSGATDFGTAFANAVPTSNAQCVHGYGLTPTLTPGWDQVCVINTCTGGACPQETYTGTLIIHGQRFDYPVDWVGQIQQTCAQVVNAPTYQPSKEPKLNGGKISAIVLVSVFGVFALIGGVWAIVVGFRRFKRQNGVNDGSEVTDPGCTWQGWF